jgi:prepilin-type N-terminal cleavage/methylation domain-containing protein
MMIIMRHNNGFSLIETLIAIVIASLSVLALLQATSNASRKSFESISNFDGSVMMGLMAQMTTTDNRDTTLYANEVVATHYTLDNDEIIESLKNYSYTQVIPKTDMLIPAASIEISSAPQLTYQKMILKNASAAQSFYSIGSFTQ